MGSDYHVKPLDEATWPAYEALVIDNGSMVAGCWCMAFHEQGVGKGSTATENHDRRLARVRADRTHAALVFRDENCVGWCQYGRTEELPNIKSRAAYAKGATTADVPDWRIACCYAGKGHRRQGVSAAGLAGALELIAAAGGGLVEGYPEPAGAVPAGFLFNGSLTTYEKLGFARVRPIGKHRWVVARTVPAS